MNRRLHLVVLAVDGSIASAVYGPLEILSSCRMIQETMRHPEPAEITWEVRSPDGESFVASSGFRMPTDGGLEDLPDGSVVFFPGFGLLPPPVLLERLERYRNLQDWLRRQHAAGCVLAAACTGNFALAEAGLLGERATTNWMFAELFEQRYPDIRLDFDTVMVEHDRVISLGGILCGMDLLLVLVERFVSPEVARLCAKFLVIDNRRPSKVPFERQQPTLHQDPMIARAVDWIRDNLHERCSLDDVVAQVPTSKRNLSRRFRETTGESPKAYIQRLRIDRAKVLLETSDLSLERILERVGYADGSAFTRLFRSHTSLTPREYRERFRIRA